MSRHATFPLILDQSLYMVGAGFLSNIEPFLKEILRGPRQWFDRRCCLILDDLEKNYAAARWRPQPLQAI
jgi:hypothetical protein